MISRSIFATILLLLCKKTTITHARLIGPRTTSNNYNAAQDDDLDDSSEGSNYSNSKIVIHVQSNNNVKKNASTKHNMSSAIIMMHQISDDIISSDDFIHEDYWFSFRPLKLSSSDAQQWEVTRIPKNDSRGRKLSPQQSIIVDETESVNNDSDGASESIVNTHISSDSNKQEEEEEEEEEDNNGSSNKVREEEIMITNILLSLSCVIMAALAAGLTMGMLSLDPLSLEIKRRASPSPKEKQWSAQLLPLLVGHTKRHRLLVSLLLLNSLANEALPLFLDQLLPNKYAAIIVSVTLVLFFGEIVPSAFFTGPNQVEVAAKLVPLVNTVMFVLSPIATPIARLLDRILHDDDGSHGGSGGGGPNDISGTIGGTGVSHHTMNGSSDYVGEDVTEGNYYNRTELSALVRIQYESQLADKRRRKQQQSRLLLTNNSTIGGPGGGGLQKQRPNPTLETMSSHISKDSIRSTNSTNHSHNSIRAISRELTSSPGARPPVSRMPSIHRDEITMIEGALAMTTKRAADVCTPLRRVYALPTDTVLCEDTMVDVWARGYSRVPVYLAKEEPATPDPSCSASSFEDISSIVGVLLVRQLIVVDSSENRPLSTLPLVRPPCISPSMHLVDIINLFQASGGRGRGGLHLAIVVARPHLAMEAFERGECIPKEAGVVGIITLEDVVEELLQEEIYDEADRDLELSRWGVTKWKKFVKRKKMKRLMEEKKRAGAETGVATTEATPLLEAVVEKWQS